MAELFWSALFLALVGCATAAPATDFREGEIYRHALKVQVNNQGFSGFGIADLAKSYLITVTTEDRIDLLTWRTCDQEQIVEKPKSSGWFQSKTSFKLSQTEIQKTSSCGGLIITALTKERKQLGLAFIDFKDARPEVGLNAIVTCNGFDQSSHGVGGCQAAAGLINQKIKFRQPVVQVGAGSPCAVMQASGDETTYTFQMPKDLCTFYFVSNEREPETGKRYIYRFTTLGYTAEAGGY